MFMLILDMKFQVHFRLLMVSNYLMEKSKKNDIKKIERMIMNKNKEFLKYWDEHTDGLTVDLNQALGLIQY